LQEAIEWSGHGSDTIHARGQNAKGAEGEQPPRPFGQALDRWEL
jgi:hypothetical protein